ncbi:MAG: hypothetical protein M1814_005476 [Vezdaea aestivalis]|nr:MAG: hypothetical protein M1814_005476 [Vezdaea aestivalis]
MHMRHEKVSDWRQQLPPPFDKCSPALRRRGSTTLLDSKIVFNEGLPPLRTIDRKRRDSNPDAVDQVDRSVNWLRFIHGQHKITRQRKSECALRKLRGPSIREQSIVSKENTKAPAQDELLALTYDCFPPIEDSRVIITEYTENALRTTRYTLEEVLASKCILQPGDLAPRVRWIYVEHYKMGTFWGSDFRFSQWGTDPALFERSPIVLLQDRLAELDREAGRLPIEDEDLPNHKHIGKYYRQTPGCPEYLGLRVNSSAWLSSEPYALLLDFLKKRPKLFKELQNSKRTDLEYGLAYADAVQCIKKSVFDAKTGLGELHRIATEEDVYLYGSWDDNVERLEFYRDHTLLSCGSPRFYEVVANRLQNDEMMQDAPERALNKIFARLRNTRGAGREHMELLFTLQQAVLDGLEYLEENKRELPIWGIPPFDNHQVCFHPDHAPPPKIQQLIQDEMDLIDKDFNTAIRHWKVLKSKVDRHLDVLLQFRVLEQQELSVSQSHLATKKQSLAIDEAKSLRLQSRSIFIFTAITIIFLPLSFLTSYFGMNFTDIAKTVHTTSYFWMTAGPVAGFTVLVILFVMRFLNVRKHPILDEELARTSTRTAESENSNWAQWKLGITKFKNC